MTSTSDPPPPGETDWQPIETAPKAIIRTDGMHDYGERILAWPCFGEVMRVRWWQTNQGGQASNFICDGGNAVRPTHWMPLPPPPNT